MTQQKHAYEPCFIYLPFPFHQFYVSRLLRYCLTTYLYKRALLRRLINRKIVIHMIILSLSNGPGCTLLIAHVVM
jgi:hypothetical protein